MEEQPLFRPAEQVAHTPRRAVMEPQAAPLWGGGDDDVTPAERSGFERSVPSQAAEPVVVSAERSGFERSVPSQAAEPVVVSAERSGFERSVPSQAAEPVVVSAERSGFERSVPSQAAEPVVVSAERSGFERSVPSQAAEPVVVSAERSGFERSVPSQAAEPFLTPAEQSSERVMPGQMRAMTGQDPFGTVPAMQAGAAASDRTFPAMQAGVPAGDGLTAALKVGADATGRTFPAMQAGVPAGDGLTAALKVGADGTVAQTDRTRAMPMQGVSAAANSSAGGGSAGAGFVAIPEQYRAAAGPVLGVADQLKELATSMSGYLHGMHANSPWGNDDDGKTFANGEDGEPGYLDNALDIMDGLKKLPEIVETIGKRLKGLADSYENSEQFNLDALGKPELPYPGTGQPDLVLRDIANGKLNGRH